MEKMLGCKYILSIPFFLYYLQHIESYFLSNFTRVFRVFFIKNKHIFSVLSTYQYQNKKNSYFVYSYYIYSYVAVVTNPIIIISPECLLKCTRIRNVNEKLMFLVNNWSTLIHFVFSAFSVSQPLRIVYSCARCACERKQICHQSSRTQLLPNRGCFQFFTPTCMRDTNKLLIFTTLVLRCVFTNCLVSIVDVQYGDSTTARHGRPFLLLRFCAITVWKCWVPSNRFENYFHHFENLKVLAPAAGVKFLVSSKF